MPHTLSNPAELDDLNSPTCRITPGVGDHRVGPDLWVCELIATRHPTDKARRVRGEDPLPRDRPARDHQPPEPASLTWLGPTGQSDGMSLLVSFCSEGPGPCPGTATYRVGGYELITADPQNASCGNIAYLGAYVPAYFKCLRCLLTARRHRHGQSVGVARRLLPR